jgi:hypothetical protein
MITYRHINKHIILYYLNELVKLRVKCATEQIYDTAECALICSVLLFITVYT